MLLLDVADDGAGFATDTPSPAGRYGLAGMRRRVTRVAGTLAIESAPGDGTTVNHPRLSDPDAPGLGRPPVVRRPSTRPVSRSARPAGFGRSARRPRHPAPGPTSSRPRQDRW
ncbi:hypothetical protein FRACA_350027 [Frankia canadensis]|uniref:Histidine kinase/HSP90-like ATPase domain-containing protein n=1 Tax=Frankia canadensis TaxID=1836972 RepID=A0A2I2KVA4_9ACTN|nr:hypothetical protein FRACA_350027 [Frankia canadensis]SOU56893.1 hypothetical protein FRACA_350027 [Frankia canadensis]